MTHCVIFVHRRGEDKQMLRQRWLTAAHVEGAALSQASFMTSIAVCSPMERDFSATVASTMHRMMRSRVSFFRRLI